MINKRIDFNEIDSLQTLAEMISEVMGGAVTIEDELHRLLAYSMHDPSTDPARIATIIGRRVPEHVQHALYESGAMQQLLNSEEPQRIQQLTDVGLSSRLAISIRHYDEVIGYIWLLDDGGSYTAEQMQQFQESAKIAASKIVLQQQRQQKLDLLRQLLNGRFQSEQEAMKQAQHYGIHLLPLSCVIVIEYEEQQKVEGWIEKIHQAAGEQLIQVQLYMQEHNRFILLCGMHSGVAADLHHIPLRIESAMERMRLLLPVQEEIYYAAGEQVSSVLHIQRSYRQARELLQLHHHLPETRSIFYYPHTGFYRYLPAIQRETEQLPIPWGPLDRLAAYDQEHNSNLLQTLAVFLDHDSDVKQSASHLHVHTNTLNYRLRRISEVGGVNLDSMAQKVTLYLELKLLWFDAK